MISKNQVLAQLNKTVDYICIVELASSLGASVSEVRQRLKDLGDKVENNNRDEWRITRQISNSNILSKSERAERDALENTIQQAFYIAGQNLKILRDKRLYRETHNSFNSYVKERFDFSRRAADYLIASADVMENLKREQFVLRTNVLPSKESHCRPLTKLSPIKQTEAWERAVEKAAGKMPNSRLIQEAVKEIKSVDSIEQDQVETKPSFKEVNYTAGLGVEYTVRLDEQTYKRLQTYQDKIGSATKIGAIARLLDEVDE